MAKRKSINKRLSRYSLRSSAGSGFLDPNSELIGEDEPFWWNKLSNSRSVEYSLSNETSRHLNADSHIQSMVENQQWWKLLQTSNSSSNEKKHIEANRQEIENKYITSDTDEEENDLPLRKRKIQIRKRPIQNRSNIFKKALDDTKSSVSSETKLLKNSMTKHTNDTEPNKQSLEGLDHTEKHASPIKNNSSTSSIDKSRNSNKFLKHKQNIFRKKLKKKNSYNAFDTLLKDNDNDDDDDDSDNKSEKIETPMSNSSAKLMDNKNMSTKTVVDKSKEESKEKSKLSSSGPTVFIKSMRNSEIVNYDDNNLIPQNRTNSSFSFLSSSDESSKLDIITDPSYKSLSKNVSTNEKKSSIMEKNADSTMRTSTKIRDSVTKETIENQESGIRNEKSLENERHVTITAPNKSKMENSIKITINNSNLIKTINASQRESMHEKNSSISRIINKSTKFETITTNMASKNLTDVSDSTSDEIDNIEKEKTASSVSSDSKNNAMNVNEKSDIISKNQMHTINSNNNSVHPINAIEYTSKNETLKRKISTLQNSQNISNNNEENILQINNKTLVKDLDMNAVSLKQTSSRIMDADDVNNEQNGDNINSSNRKISNAININHQKKINEYFATTTSKLDSPINARLSKPLEMLSNTKENKEVKKKVNKKSKTTIGKLINAHFTTVRKDSSLEKKQLIEKIKEYRDMGTKKSETKKIDKAYIVNGKVYKRPKLPRPKSWATNRLYKFLWKKMQPKYKLLTRVQSEKFVKELSDVVSIIIKTKKYSDYKTLLNNLMENMATVGIITTANDFYDFCYDYLPYDFRVKVVPMILPGNVRNIPFNPTTLNEPILKN
ncbi:PREDICTED: putative uncharacterized protein DDB_G0286901 [Polistes dominula]|uniref:Uncharacterized protein n=1 Tax=Polistes dominula TaxID=743375 RepID=A0ABM1I8Q9_POLDO|nr:PREDICTED: putative uncharacterized protein DDB_G0286901 [Polistes dominula]